MGEMAAVREALEVMHMPSRVRVARAAPLPEGVPRLLAIAAGDEEATASAAEAAKREHGVVRDAAAFYIEQILLAPESDSYRVLAAPPDATTAELRRNMAMLLRWLHPDKDKAGDRSRFAARVTLAWDDLKTPERRAAYDKSREATQQHQAGTDRRRRHATTGARHRPPQPGPKPVSPPRSDGSGLIARTLRFLLGRTQV